MTWCRVRQVRRVYMEFLGTLYGPYFFHIHKHIAPRIPRGRPKGPTSIAPGPLLHLPATAPRASPCAALCPWALPYPWSVQVGHLQHLTSREERVLGFPLDDRFTRESRQVQGADSGNRYVRIVVKAAKLEQRQDVGFVLSRDITVVICFFGS
jgi:hypothetical protein